MLNLFTITIPDSPSALLVTYGAGALIRVQSSPTQAGIYGDVVTIPIVAGISSYAVYDTTATSVTDWYAIRYEAADGDPAGNYSAAFQPMPLDGVYASLSDFNIFLRDSGSDSSEDVMKLLALTAASRAIDTECNRRFEIAATTATARVFGPPNFLTPDSYVHSYLEIDDLADKTSIDSVKFDTTGNGDYNTTVTAYRVGPTNAASRGLPYTRLTFDSGTYPPRWDESVEVTAKWGWDAVPTTITQACLLQAARFFKRRDAAFGVAGSPEMGNELRLLQKLDVDVALMVGPYKRMWGAV